MIEAEPKVKLEEKPAGPRVDIEKVTGEIILFDIDDEIHRRELEKDPFPLDDYEDLGAYVDRAYE